MVESNLMKRMPINVVCNIQILLVPLLSGSVGSGGNSDLIPCNTVKDPVKYHSFLPHVMLSVLFSKYRAKPFVRTDTLIEDTGEQSREFPGLIRK